MPSSTLNILVTGSTDGIGLRTAVELARQGHRVLVHGRDPERGTAALQQVAAAGRTDAAPSLLLADFAAPERVTALACDVDGAVPHLDVLINNAGTYEAGRLVGDNGIERTFQVNYLATFVLTLALLPTLLRARRARVVNVASISHAWEGDFASLAPPAEYDGLEAYERAKLAQIMFTYSLAERLDPHRITANCLDPGTIDTKVLHAGWNVRGTGVEVGARQVLHVALHTELHAVTGKYFVNNRPARSAPISYDAAQRDVLWRASVDQTGFDLPDTM